MYCFIKIWRPLTYGVILSTLLSVNAFSDQADEKVQHKEETRRKLQFENDRVKVWKTIIPPHQPLKMHRHDYPRIVVGLKGGILKKIEQDNSVSELKFETGKAYFLEADPKETLHADVNEGTETIEVMVIELKDR